MRIFATGTGRCCSVTFSKACKHFKGFTSNHETITKDTILRGFYPDNNVESDPRLFWRLPQVVSKYPDAVYVHLWRKREPCIKSLAKRVSLKLFAKFIAVDKFMSIDQVATCYYDFFNTMLLHYSLHKGIDVVILPTPVTAEDWHKFVVDKLGLSELEYENSFKEWGIKHNAS